jgi:hypothetical protein
MASGVQDQREVMVPREVESAAPMPLYLRAVSFPAMLAFLLLGAVFGATLAFRLDPDVWWHVNVGERILRTGHWPAMDSFSFTATNTPWIAYEWLGEIALALFVRIGGVQGLEAFQLLVGGGVLVAIYAFATLRSGNSKAGFVSASALMIFATLSFSLRPQMLGYLFLLLTLIVLELFRHGKPRALVALPFLFLLWVNTHGSFIIGIGILVLCLVSGLKDFQFGGIEARAWTPQQRRQLETALLFSLAALMITPYGTELAVYPFDMAFNQPLNVANILEWQPMPFQLVGGKLFLGVVLAFFVAQTVFRMTWSLYEYLLVLGGIAMATLHVRFVLLFVPFFAPVLATFLARWIPAYEAKKDKFILNAILMAVAVGCVLYYFPSKSDLEKKVATSFPVGAAQYLHEHVVPGPMYNTYGYGGYLIWSFDGQHKVFIDGRADIYERAGVLADYLAIARPSPQSLKVLSFYNVQSVLIDKDENMVAMLSASPEWQNVYQDKMSVLFVRNARRLD